jgi:Fe-S oxidoreductase
MAALKAEFLAHYHEANGVPLRSRIFGQVRTLNRYGSALAPLSNWLSGPQLLRAALQRVTGIDQRRPLPRYRRETLQRWFVRRPTTGMRARRGPVIFLADSFTSYTEPEIGRAAIELLELAGWEVRLAADLCCGRALISKGLLHEARATQAALIQGLASAARAGTPIVGCEPSCVFTLTDELTALAPADAAVDASTIARQVRLVDDLVLDAVRDGSLELAGDSAVAGRSIVFHAHCHQKAANAVAGSSALLEQIPRSRVATLDAGCCGMAGSFGFEREHYDLSMQIGGMRLFPAINAAAADTIVAATGVSCRQQIAHGTGRRAEHPITIVRAALRTG